MNGAALHPSAGYSGKEQSAEIVNASMAQATDPRLDEVMAMVIKHLHAAIKEAGVTQTKWMQAIQFLNATGQMCSEWRQEFILLSDVLGVSMLVDAISNDRPDNATANSVLGPFRVNNAPR